VYAWKNLNDYEKLKTDLKTVSKLTVMGLNLKSLECISTIKKKYPEMEITVVDENERDRITIEFGELVQ
jgi:uncharacterized phage-like protein YoqJ